MPEYIEREKAYELARTSELYSDFHRSMADLTSLKELLEDTPTADVVPSAVLEQVMWERDMALETLKEHGIGFCEKSDVGEVVRCKDCEYLMFSDSYGECAKGYMGIVSPYDFCSKGKRKEVANNG